MVLVQKEGGIRSWLVACVDTVFRVLRLQSELSLSMGLHWSPALVETGLKFKA